MSYYDRGYNNNYNHHHRGGFRHHQPRINENQVPQSKHTIFIRGLPGDVTTEDIKEYIGERVGKISFDFVKTALDRSKIFVAVRFEKREEAKEFMETYQDREFMGCRCELSWFRDIRRYCAYQRSKQVRSNSQRRRRRSDSDESRHSSRRSTPGRRTRSGSRDMSRDSRSASRGRSRSPTRSRSRDSRRTDRDRSRSRSIDRRRSRSGSRGSRRSRDDDRNDSRSGMSSAMDRSMRGDPDAEKEQERLRERLTRNKRRREMSRSPPPPESEEEPERPERPERPEKPSKRKTKEEVPQQIPLPPKYQKEQAPAAPKPKVFIPPPTVDMELESPKSSPPPRQQQQHHVNPYQPNQTYSTLYSVPMEEEAAPKVVKRDAPPPPVPAPMPNIYAAPQAVAQAAPAPQQMNVHPPPTQAALPAPAPASQAAFVPRQVGKIEIVMPAALPATQNAAPTQLGLNGTGIMAIDATILPSTHKFFGHLKAFQSTLISTVKFEPPEKDEKEDEFSSLRLSSMASDEDSEERKMLEREEKLTKLNDEQMMRFMMKRKQFEQAFRNDCETYTVVTRALLAKDESLLFGLKMSLLENMEDLYKKFMKRVDDLLNTLVVIA